MNNPLIVSFLIIITVHPLPFPLLKNPAAGVTLFGKKSGLFHAAYVIPVTKYPGLGLPCSC
jgi:hypothetical protein